MRRHTQQIGGVTVTFTMGHVNELRGAVNGFPASSQGAGGLHSASPHFDYIAWLSGINGIPAGWGSAPFHSQGVSHD
jgi:hypothetical protein